MAVTFTNFVPLKIKNIINMDNKQPTTHCPLAEYCRHNIDGDWCSLEYEECDGVACPDYDSFDKEMI